MWKGTLFYAYNAKGLRRSRQDSILLGFNQEFKDIPNCQESCFKCFGLALWSTWSTAEHSQKGQDCQVFAVVFISCSGTPYRNTIGKTEFKLSLKCF